jgi:hypothetical protein
MVLIQRKAAQRVTNDYSPTKCHKHVKWLKYGGVPFETKRLITSFLFYKIVLWMVLLPMSSYVIPAIRLTCHICTCIPFLVDKFYMYTLCTYNESSFFPVCIPSQKQSEVILKDTCAYQNLYPGHTLIQWVGWKNTEPLPFCFLALSKHHHMFFIFWLHSPEEIEKMEPIKTQKA